MKKVVRKQLKEDEFVTTVNKIINFIRKRTKELVAFSVLVIFVVIIFVAVNLFSGQNRKKESRLLTQILNLHSGLNNTPENTAKLEKLAGTGKFSRLAYITLATHWMEKGNYDQAQDYLEKIPKGPKDIFYYQAQDLLGQAHLKRKSYDEAIEIYKKIDKENPKDYSLDVILFHLAEVYEEEGEVEEAIALYKRVQDEFPQTYYSYDASQKVGKLEAKK